jgi:hypothetical protein
LEALKKENKTLKEKLKKNNRRPKPLTEEKENAIISYYEVNSQFKYFFR